METAAAAKVPALLHIAQWEIGSFNQVENTNFQTPLSTQVRKWTFNFLHLEYDIHSSFVHIHEIQFLCMWQNRDNLRQKSYLENNDWDTCTLILLKTFKRDTVVLDIRGIDIRGFEYSQHPFQYPVAACEPFFTSKIIFADSVFAELSSNTLSAKFDDQL